MARRLNTLLHELKLTPGAAVTTKDQLESLFLTEADRMSEHLDNLQFAARRVGSDAALAARADIEIGWAYRLIGRLVQGHQCSGNVMIAERSEWSP